MERRRKTTRRLAAAALMAALGTALLTVGAFVDVLDLTAAALASLTVVFAVIELRGPYPYMIYAVTALLSILLLPVKTPGLVYALFAGYYPVVKAVFERHFPRPVAWLFKILLFNAALALAVFLVVRFFMAPGTVERWHYWLLLIGTPVFILYDLALTRLITAYLLRWRRRLHLFCDDE